MRTVYYNKSCFVIQATLELLKVNLPILDAADRII